MKPGIICLLIILTVLGSCSNDDDSDANLDFNSTCFPNADFVAFYENEEATVRLLNCFEEGEDYFLVGDGLTNPQSELNFLPCNLARSFAQDGLQVVVSGYLVQGTFEDACAKDFEITEIELQE